VTALSATVDTNSAAITIEAAVRAAAVAPNYSGSTAYGLNSLVVFNNSVYRGKAASIPVGTVPTNTTYWEPYTTTTASYVLKLDVNGKIAGFGLENTGTASLFEIVADKFAVVTSTGSGTVAPFIVSSGAVYLASAIIQAASISVAKVQSAFMDSLVAAQGTLVSAHIGDLQITSAKIAATLQSNNFVAGTSGWAINKSGTMELNELTARGTLTASNVIGSYIAGSYMSAPSIYTAGSHAVAAVTAGATSITLKDVSGFSNSGTGIIYGATNNRDTFTWTGRNTSTNQLTGIVTTGGNALLAHPVGSIVVQSNVPTIMISPAAGEFYLRGDRGDGVIEELATIGNSQIGSDFYIARFGGTGNRAGVWASSGSSTGVVAVSSTGPGMEARSTSGLALSALSTNGPGASVGGGKTQYDLQIITPLVSGDPALPTHDTSPARSVIQGRAAIGQPARLFYNGTGDGEDWAEFVCQKSARHSAISGSGSISGTFARGFWYIRPNTDTTITTTVNDVSAAKTVAANTLESFYSDGDVGYSSTGTLGVRTINYRYIPT
jgi:hypothetical protein